MQVNGLNTNLAGMVQAQQDMNQLAQTVASVSNTVADPQNQAVTQDLVDAITQQIPTQIAYEANAKGIQTQDAVQESLLNIKA